MLSIHHAAPREQQQRDGQHAVYSKERSVRMVDRKVGSVLEIVDYREVDEKSENSRPEEVPEGTGYEKIHRPFV